MQGPAPHGGHPSLQALTVPGKENGHNKLKEDTNHAQIHEEAHCSHLACLMLATLFVGCGKKDDGGSSGGDTIKLGWMGSLTGDQAAYGTCESQTLKMMVEDLNANGGLLGKQVELICYDTKGDAQEAVNVAKRLCAQDQVCAIIGPNASGQCIAIQSVLDQYKISDMSTVATNEKVTMQDGHPRAQGVQLPRLLPRSPAGQDRRFVHRRLSRLR